MVVFRGEKGFVYDCIVFNVVVIDYLLGCIGVESFFIVVERVRDVIDSGWVLNVMLNYIERSRL